MPIGIYSGSSRLRRLVGCVGVRHPDRGAIRQDREPDVAAGAERVGWQFYDVLQIERESGRVGAIARSGRIGDGPAGHQLHLAVSGELSGGQWAKVSKVERVFGGGANHVWVELVHGWVGYPHAVGDGHVTVGAGL